MRPITLFESDADGIGNATNTSYRVRFVVNDKEQFREAMTHDIMFSKMRYGIRAEQNF